MNRGHVLKELGSYLDNQLSEKEKFRVEEHLELCQSCSQELKRLKAISEKLKAWGAPLVDASFDARVRNEIVAWELERGEVKMKKRTLPILVPAGVLVGILVFMFAVQMFPGYLKRGVQGRIQDRQNKIVMGYGSLEKRKGDQNMILYDGLEQPIAEPYYMRYEAEDSIAVRDRHGISKGALAISPVPTDGPVIVIQPVLPATGEGEKIIRTGNVKLEVENGKDTYQKAAAICQELGGYLASSNFYQDEAGREAGTITMRIPKDKFILALDRLGALGKVENISTDSRDASQEYANLKAELDAAMVVYNKMLEALQKRQVNIPETVRLESELSPILRRVADLRNKIEYLNNAISFTTITVNFHEAKVSAKALKDTGRLFKESLIKTAINAVKFFAGAIPLFVLVLVLFAIILPVALIAKHWIIRLFKRE